LSATIGGFAAFTDLKEVEEFGAKNMKVVPFDYHAVLGMFTHYPAEIFVINPGANQIEIDGRKIEFLYQTMKDTGSPASGHSTSH